MWAASQLVASKAILLTIIPAGEAWAAPQLVASKAILLTIIPAGEVWAAPQLVASGTAPRDVCPNVRLARALPVRSTQM